MASSLITVLTGAMAGGIAIIGWRVAQNREDRARRIEAEINRIEKQIEEIYGPLLNLVQQLDKVLNQRDEIKRNLSSDDEKMKVEEFVWKEYFFPLHVEARELIKSKNYLIDDEEVLNGINGYLEHSLMELLKKRIDFEVDDVSTYATSDKPFPGELRRSLDRVISQKRRYRDKLISNVFQKATLPPG